MTWDELEYLLRSDGIDEVMSLLRGSASPLSTDAVHKTAQGLRAAWECRPNTGVFLKFMLECPLDNIAPYLSARIVLGDGSLYQTALMPRFDNDVAIASAYAADFMFPRKIWLPEDSYALLALVSAEVSEHIRLYMLDRDVPSDVLDALNDVDWEYPPSTR